MSLKIWLVALTLLFTSIEFQMSCKNGGDLYDFIALSLRHLSRKYVPMDILGPTQVKCRLLVSNIFDAINNCLEIMEIMLWILRRKKLHFAA